MKRELGLDITRSVAIILVLIHHLTQMCLPQLVGIHAYSSLGKYGVDLFFGLSGYLIGGLYWKEFKLNGNVNVFKFILKRSIRTIPPYYIALGMSYLSVWIFREETFRMEYLFFIQNYFKEIPYFLISWSLCIEEHFYVVLPLLLIIIIRYFQKSIFQCLLILSIIPLILRTIHLQDLTTDFGYYFTATHLHYEGLIFGVIFSYVTYFKTSIYSFFIRFRFICLFISILLLLSMNVDYVLYNYTIGLFLLRLFFAMTIMGFSKIKTGIKTINSTFAYLSKNTYSIYLMHGLVIHLGIYIGSRLGFGNWGILCLSIIMIGFVSTIFYRLIDINVLRLRSKILNP